MGSVTRSEITAVDCPCTARVREAVPISDFSRLRGPRDLPGCERNSETVRDRLTVRRQSQTVVTGARAVYATTTAVVGRVHDGIFLLYYGTTRRYKTPIYY